MREYSMQGEKDIKKERMLDITNLGLFINQSKILNRCLSTFEDITKQNVTQAQKAREFKAGGCSNRVQLNYDAGVFYISKQCDGYDDEDAIRNATKEKDIIRKLSKMGITLPLVEKKKSEEELLAIQDLKLLEQVAGIQSLQSINENIEKLQKERAFLPFIKCLVIQLFDKLRLIHELGYAHSDIKPHNIVMGFDRNFYFIDFGAMVRYTGQDRINYMSSYTRQYNTQHFLTKINKQNCKEIIAWDNKEIIACDNAQLSLSILVLLVTKKSHQSFNEMTNEQFIQLFYQIYQKLRNPISNLADEEEKIQIKERNKDLISILFFLYSYILYPDTIEDIIQNIKAFTDKNNNQATQELQDEIVQLIREINIQPNTCNLKSTLYMQDLIDFHSKIEEIQFIENNNQIEIKSITPSNILLIELLSQIGYQIKCTNFLDVHYHIIHEYKELLLIALEKKKLTKRIDNQNNIKTQIFSIEKVSVYFNIRGQFEVYENNKLTLVKDIYINMQLEIYNKFTLKDEWAFYSELLKYLAREITSFKTLLKSIKHKFQHEASQDFKSQYNRWVLEKPKEIIIGDSNLKNYLAYFEQILTYNSHLNSISLNLKEFKEFDQLYKILLDFGGKKRKEKKLELKDITHYDEQFSLKILQGDIVWDSLVLLHKPDTAILVGASYVNFYLPRAGFKCKQIKITFQQTNNHDFDQVCQGILWACHAVEKVELDFQNTTIQQEDDSFRRMFESKQNKQLLIKSLVIHLQNDEKDGEINYQLIEFLKGSKELQYFKLIVNKVKDRNAKKQIFDKLRRQVQPLQQKQTKLQIDLQWGEEQPQILTPILKESSNDQFEKRKHISQNNLNITTLQNQLFVTMQRSVDTLQQIHFNQLATTNQMLVEIFYCMLDCSKLEALTISLEKLQNYQKQLSEADQVEQIDTAEEDIFKKKLKMLTSFNIDFSSVVIDYSIIQEFINFFLQFPPSQFSNFQIHFGENVDGNMKVPKKISINDSFIFIGQYYVSPSFNGSDRNYKTKKIEYVQFTKNKNFQKIIAIDLTDTYNKEQIEIEELKLQISYIFSRLFTTINVSKFLLTVGQVNYDISRQISKYLNKSYKRYYESISFQEISLEYKDQDIQCIKELISLLVVRERKVELKVYLFNFSVLVEKSTEFFNFNSNSQHFLKIMDYYDETNKERDLEKFRLYYSNLSQIQMIYTKESLYQKAKQQFEAVKTLQIILEDKMEEQKEDQSKDLLLLKDCSSSNYYEDYLSSSLSSAKDQLDESFIHKQPSSESSKLLILKMISENFRLYVPYYKVNYAKEQHGYLDQLIIGQDISRFSISEEQFKYLEILQVMKKDNSVLDQLEIDFSNQNLNLDLVYRILKVMQEKRDQIRCVNLNFRNSILSLNQTRVQIKLQKIASTLSTYWKHINTLILNLNTKQFDSISHISSFLFPNLIKFEVFIPDFSDLLKIQLLQQLESLQKLETYCVKYEAHQQLLQIKLSDQIHLEYNQRQNSFQIFNEYCLGLLCNQIKQRISNNIKPQISEITFNFERAQYISDRFVISLLGYLKDLSFITKVNIIVTDYETSFIQNLIDNFIEFPELKIQIFLSKDTYRHKFKERKKKQHTDDSCSSDNQFSSSSSTFSKASSINKHNNIPKNVIVKQYSN